MKLLYISTFLFLKDDEKTYALPSCADMFFQKYLDVFDGVTVLGEPVKSYLDKTALIPIQDNRIDVHILKPNTSPKDFINDREVRIGLDRWIKKSDAILIKPASRRGLMAIKLAKKYNKPYMIEMTGDIHNALRQHPNVLKRCYSPLLYRKICNAIYDCKFGLYVSKEYLQHEFPINGLMCGCSDVVLEQSDESILNARYDRIEKRNSTDLIKLALIGFYQGKMKGVDTAIRALGFLDSRYHLYILGNGTEDSRNKWYQYGKEKSVEKERIHFPKPLSSSKEVLHWLDGMDAFVFPTRSEGFGRCVAEAMSRGCPCFATNICTMPELLPEECLFPLDDSQRLAEMLKSCFANKNEEKQLAKKNFYHSMDYDYDVLRQRRNEFLTQFKQYCSENNEQR